MVTKGCYAGIPYLSRKCKCGDGQIKTLKQILLFCCFWKDLIKKSSGQFAFYKSDISLQKLIQMLIFEKDKRIVSLVEKLLPAVNIKRVEGCFKCEAVCGQLAIKEIQFK
uniref:Uncharacterized protein n=1 Tax=Sphaerodactylus townsendi TaxID=933632 RepID=A0ACB8GCG6_9SAUR